jgi:RNA polymerase sigma factor (sigma-70 family)
MSIGGVKNAMAQRPNSPLLRYLHKLFENKEIAALTDRQLLQRFAAGRSEAAFTVLVRRHGGMVLGVCSRVLGNPSDAEDAFQATFLVLARKSSSFGWHDSIGNWLYGVALRVAGKMKSQRRRHQETCVHLRSTSSVSRAPRDPCAEAVHRELAEKLDAALRRLPSRFRAPLVLCYLEGRTHQEAARELGLPAGSISRRVARGLELLRERLAQSGLCLSHQAVVGLLANGTWRAIVERTLAEATAHAGLVFKLGAWTAVGTASTRIITVAEGVLRTMILANLKVVMVGVVAVGLLGAGGALQGRRLGGGDSHPEGQDLVVQQGGGGAAAVAPDRPMPPDSPPLTGFAEIERKYNHLRSKLSHPVVLEKGLDKMTFGEAKAYFEDRFDLTILVNFAAFPKSDKHPQEKEVQLEKMSGVSLQTALDMFMDQIGGTYVIRTDYVEITTPEFVRTESWVTGDRTFVPRVHADFKDVPLDQAVRELAIQSGFTIVLDRHALGDSLMPRVTALLESVCLDTAVEMLANMGGLKAVALDRTFYITEEENADKLEAQQAQRRAAREKVEEKRKKEAEEKEKKTAAGKNVA